MSKKTMELYIHIPFCIKKCQYCDFLSFAADESTQNDYVQALLREIAYYGPHCMDYLVTTVYIGGGTPSWLREESMEEIMTAVKHSFALASDAEVSIECNPGTITGHKFQVYRDSGINRLSIGLQSADNEELKVIGRIHTWEQFLKTYEMARDHGFSNINIDLMYSLPGQTAETWYASLQKVLRLRPEHISAYSLIIEKGTPFYDLYKFDAVKQQAGLPTDALPTEEEVYRMTKMTEQLLKEAGYEHYEISNFALPGFACRHNIGYWKRIDYLGVGLGSASLLDNIRYTNTNELYTYLKEAERQTEKLSGIFIDSEITKAEKQLRAGNQMRFSRGMMMNVRALNRRMLQLINGLIEFKEQILREIADCRLYTTNYPLLIEHILREARLYRATILELERRGGIVPKDLREMEQFWNQIMMEHALFIRGLLDPTECELIETADGFAKDYCRLLEEAKEQDLRTMDELTRKTIETTQEYQKFKTAGTEGITDCKIRSIILPLLADHVLREANHYLRILADHGIGRD